MSTVAKNVELNSGGLEDYVLKQSLPTVGVMAERPSWIPAEIWDWYNLKGDAFALVLHFFIGLALLTMIELEVNLLFLWCPHSGYRYS